jgi:alpha-L-fucosidase
VKEFTLEAFAEGDWKEIASGTTIGYKRILRLPTIRASMIRLNIKQAKACPLISNLEVYNAPKVLTEPEISRDKQGMVSLSAADPEVKIFFTVDGSGPDQASTVYGEPFAVPGKMIVKAVAVDEATGLKSPVSTREFDVAKTKWSVLLPPDDAERSSRAIDDNPSTTWVFAVEKFPAETVVDLGESLLLTGITYLPDQRRRAAGIIEKGECYVSEDGKDWGDPVTAGELPNMLNSPVWQKISFPEKKGRYLKVVVTGTVNEEKRVGIAELGILTR